MQTKGAKLAANPPREVTRENERRAWELRRQLWTEQRIADEIGVDVSTVSRMLRRIEVRYSREFAETLERVKGEQTAQLQYLADEALQGWERSKCNAESLRTIKEDISLKGTEETQGDDGQPVRVKKAVVPASKTTTTFTSEGQAGEPKFLSEARGALSDIRDIWGIEAPKRSNVSISAVSDEELEEEIKRRIARASGGVAGGKEPST